MADSALASAARHTSAKAYTDKGTRKDKYYSFKDQPKAKHADLPDNYKRVLRLVPNLNELVIDDYFARGLKKRSKTRKINKKKNKTHKKHKKSNKAKKSKTYKRKHH